MQEHKMDLNDRDSAFEQQEKTLKTLQEGWKSVLTGKKEVLTESKDAFAKQKELKNSNKPKPAKAALKEEAPIAKDEPIPGEEPAPAPVAVDAPEGADAIAPAADGAAPAVDPADGAVPAVDAATVPTGLQPNEEKKLATQQFVQSALKGVTSGEAKNEDLVTEYGFYKAEITDPANGTYVVVAFPADMKLTDIAAVAEPVASPAEVAATGDAAAEVAPAVGGEEAGKVEPGLESSPEDKAEGDIETATGAEDESLNESVRDPISVGKKNWAKYIRTLLTEGKKAAETICKEACEDKKEDKVEENAEEKKEDKKELKEEEKPEGEEAGEVEGAEKEEVKPEEKKEDAAEEKEEDKEALAAKKQQKALLAERMAEIKRLEVRVSSIQEQIKSIKTEYFEDEKTRQEMVEAYSKALVVANTALANLKNTLKSFQL